MVFTVHDFLHQARRPAKDHCWRGASEGQKLGEESILMLVFLQLCFYVILGGPRAEPKLLGFEVPRCPALLQQGRAHSELGIVSSRHVPHCQLFSVAGDADGGFVDKAGRRFFHVLRCSLTANSSRLCHELLNYWRCFVLFITKTIRFQFFQKYQ